MKGGFNNPPNQNDLGYYMKNFATSMKGGFNNPPNPKSGSSLIGVIRNFNEGGVQ